MSWGEGGSGCSPPGVPPYFFVCCLIGWLLVWLWGGGVALIFRISIVRGGTLSLSYIHNRHSHRWGRGLLHPYHIFRIGVVRGGGASTISYIQNKRRQGVGIHPYHIFMIGAVKKGASSLSYIQNRHSQRVGIHPYHIFMIVVVKGGGRRASSISYIHNKRSQGVEIHPYHIFMIGVVKGVTASSLFYIQNRHSQGGGFIHIIYS